MHSSKLLIAWLAAGMAAGVALLLAVRHLAVSPVEVAVVPAVPALVVPAVKPVEPVPAQAIAAEKPETILTNVPAATMEPAATNRHGLKKLAGKKAAKPKEPIQDPDARVALSLVGVDPDAEDYWISAINDPTLPPEERKDFIEDLNETGLANPHQPGADDLPIIASRLQLIEELASNPNFIAGLDQVNKDAFAEAHKDLVNLLAGKPAN